MKLQTPSHPKFLLLLDRTGLPVHAVAGHLELTWLFVMEHAPQGDVGKWPDGMIERAADWSGEPGGWMQALIAAGLVCRSETHRLLIHDWPDHCPSMIKKRLERLNREPLNCRPHDTRELPAQEPDGRRAAARVGPGREGAGKEGSRRAGAGDPGGEPTGSAPAAGSLFDPKPILKPERFEGEARESILKWAKRRGLSARILDEGFALFDAWGPTENFKRPMSSWVGSFKGLVNKALKSGEIQRETEDERVSREAREFQARAEQPQLRLAGGSDV